MREFCAGASLLPTRADLVASAASSSRSAPSCRRSSSARRPACKAQDSGQVASPSMSKIITVLKNQLETAFVGEQSTDTTVKNLAAGIAAATK